MNKKLIMFSIGYFIAIMIIYIIPVIIMYPNIMNTINMTNESFVSANEYISAVQKIQEMNLGTELNTFNDVISASLKSQVNIRNYIIIFYVSMLFISLFIIAIMSIKKGNMGKYVGKGIICGCFVGAAGITATILFSSSYFIL